MIPAALAFRAGFPIDRANDETGCVHPVLTPSNFPALTRDLGRLADSQSARNSDVKGDMHAPGSLQTLTITRHRWFSVKRGQHGCITRDRFAFLHQAPPLGRLGG